MTRKDYKFENIAIMERMLWYSWNSAIRWVMNQWFSILFPKNTVDCTVKYHKFDNDGEEESSVLRTLKLWRMNGWFSILLRKEQQKNLFCSTLKGWKQWARKDQTENNDIMKMYYSWNCSIRWAITLRTLMCIETENRLFSILVVLRWNSVSVSAK